MVNFKKTNLSKIPTFLKLLVVISIFAVLLTASVRWGSAQKADPSPAVVTEPQSPQGWGDEGISEVGVEWIDDFPGTADDRSHWDESCDGLYYGLTSVGWTGRFHWTDWNAFETDFKLASLGGEENSYVDNVDIAMICTHGSGTHDNFWNKDLSSVYFGSSHADQHLSPGDAYRAYGDKDLEFLAFDSCSVLSDDGPYPYYNRGYWSTTMNGLHLLLGFKNTMYVWAPGDGAYWSVFMKGLGWMMPPLTVTQAWFSAVDYNQPTVTCARVLAETSSNYSEYLHGYGYMGPDPAVDGYYYYWDHCSTGAKKLDLESFKPSEPVLAVPVFQVQRRLVNEDYIKNIISPAFNITGTIGSDNMFFYLVDTSGGVTRTVQIDKITGSYNYRDWSKMWVTPVLTPTLPSSGRVADMIASNFFSQTPAEGLPAAWYRNAGYFYSVEQIVGEELLNGEEQPVQASSSMPVNGMLVYGRNLSGPQKTASGIQLADFPVVGPGGRLKLYFGDGSVLVGVMGGSRDVALTKATVDVMTAEEAWGKYLADPTIALPEVPWVAEYITFTSAALGYYEMPYTIDQSELIPVWIYNANFYGLEMVLLAADVPVYIPAALAYLPPEVAITDPISGTLYAPGELISFKGTVLGGKPPYTFSWSSSHDGPLGTTQDIVGKLTGAVKGGEVILNAIKLEVTDANGQSGSATVVVKVLANVYLPPILKPTPK
jgi:hypothetical protein